MSVPVERRKVRPPFTGVACALALGFALSGCEKTPDVVYVLDAPQTVELAASASALRARVGDTVVLSARRTTRGTWKRIPSGELRPGQCWMAAVPPETEASVADNLRWAVEPEGAATFNTDFRSDHTRVAVLSREGVVSLTPTTSVWCEPGRTVAAPTLRIEVTASP